MLQIDKEDLSSVFNTFDLNNDGFISEQEFAQVIRRFGHTMNAEEIKNVMATLDSNNDGLISFQEFCRIFEQKGLHCSPDFELKSAFQMLDKDNSGTISMDEIQSLVAKNNQHLNKQEIKDLLYGIDINGDAELDYEEFKALMSFSLDTM